MENINSPWNQIELIWYLADEEEQVLLIHIPSVHKYLTPSKSNPNWSQFLSCQALNFEDQFIRTKDDLSNAKKCQVWTKLPNIKYLKNHLKLQAPQHNSDFDPVDTIEPLTENVYPMVAVQCPLDFWFVRFLQMLNTILSRLQLVY